jgi:hypothetical protein
VTFVFSPPCGAANIGGSRPFKAALFFLLIFTPVTAADTNYIVVDARTRQV